MKDFLIIAVVATVSFKEGKKRRSKKKKKSFWLKTEKKSKQKGDGLLPYLAKPQCSRFAFFFETAKSC